MSFLDPKAESDAVRTAVLEQVKSMFPFEGRKNSLILKNIYVDEPAGGIDRRSDLKGQKSAKLRGRTWSVPIYGDMELRSKDGKLINAANRVKLINLPQNTERFTYIVKGGENQITHQWRLKPGIYSRIRENGELEAHFNLAKGRGFAMRFDPKKREYLLSYGQSTNVALLPVLKALGVPESKIKDAWGPEILQANQRFKDERELAKMHKAVRGDSPDNLEGAINGIRSALEGTELRKDTTKITLGVPLDTVDDKALLLASRNLLAIARGEKEPDRRDALEFKELLGIEDFMPKRIADSSLRINRQIKNNLDRRKKVREIISTDIFNLPVASMFNTALSEQTNMINPVDIISNQRKTTVLGPGGISNTNMVTMDAKLVDPSHLGYLDPIPTPEGQRAGITTFLSIMAKKTGKQVSVRVNTPDGKQHDLTPEEAVNKVVAFPDQYTWTGGKPHPIGKTVKASGLNNELTEVSPKEVDYILPSARGLFTLSTNMIPFLQNDQGNRANYGARQISQSIALKDPDAPLVQSHTGHKDPSVTWEKIVGGLFSHRSPVNGTVASVGKDSIKIRDGARIHEVPIYSNYPLNDGRSFIDATPQVKKGDSVKKGQLLADTTFTKDGVFAFGKNLRAAYLPMRELNFEDGIVISETAAKKLTSIHLYQERLYAGREITLNRDKFRAYYGDRLTDEQAKKLDSEGVIQVGQKVQPGDTLIAALRKSEPGREQLILQGIHKSLVKPYSDYSVKWEVGVPGVVEEVVRNGREVKVHVKTEEPTQVGDKLSLRHGAKGVISRILPDEEMPRTAGGDHMEILMDPAGVGGRVNPGQILETLLGKVAHERGGTYAVTNFEGNPDKRIIRVSGHWKNVPTNKGKKMVWIKGYEYERDYHSLVQEELDSNDIPSLEKLYDPLTGEELRMAEGESGVTTGFPYIMKLQQTSASKMLARGQGAGFNYDANMAPKGGGKSGAQSMGALGIYAMLAHGESAANLREMQTVKADRSQSDFWAALQAGDVLPPPKAPFAYEKFLSYLNALGVNVKKEGHELHILPMLDEEILERSNGEIKNPNRLVIAKNLKPEKGGIFDEEITGGLQGSGWSHVPLSEPLPNPLFEKAISSLLGMTGVNYRSILEGKKGVTEEGDLVDTEQAKHNGGNAIAYLLSKINVEKELAESEEKIKTVSKSGLDDVNKKIKYLRTLKRLGVSADKAYMLNNIPVIPPKFRPLGVLESGDLNVDDLNGIYQQLGIDIQQLREFPEGLPDEFKNDLRAEIYDAVKALAGLGGRLNAENKGILDIIAGTSPKMGYFQSSLISRKQDLTLRAVIVPSEGMALDEVGLPRKGAMEMYKPFVVRDLVRLGYTPLEAREEVDKGSAIAEKSLDTVVKERPVLLKRDPALHKFSVMAFKPNLVKGNTIHIHPLVTGGYNADFDGNCIIGSSRIVLTFCKSGYKLRTVEQVEEAYGMKFTGDTKIISSFRNGLAIEIEIRDVPYLPDTRLKDKNGADVYAVPAGIGVWSYHPGRGEPVLTNVTGFTIEQDCEVARVTTRQGLEVVATTNESLCVYDHKTGGIKKAAPENCVGSLSPVTRKIPNSSTSSDYELGWLIGAFVSDGFLMGTRKDIIGYSKNSNKHRDRFANALNSLEGRTVKRSTYRRGQNKTEDGFSESTKDHFYGLKKSYIFECCYADEPVDGRAALRKKLPEIVVAMSDTELFGVLTGLLDRDGAVSVSHSKSKPQILVNYGTSSKHLVSSIKNLALRLGIRLSVSFHDPKPGRMQKHRAYVISFSTVDLAKVRDRIDFSTEKYNRLFDEFLGAAMRDDRDIVPVPEKIMSLCASKAGPMKSHPSQRSVATIKSKTKPNWYVSRSLAFSMLEVLERMDTPPLATKSWATVVRSSHVHWDVVVNVVPEGTAEVFDLVVPETKIFSVNGGLVVYDTMSAYVPVTDEAVREAYTMLPSNNLFNLASGAAMYQPTLESQLGLYSITAWGKDKGKRYSSPEVLLSHANKKQVSYDEVVQVGNVKTTAGRLLVASVLPSTMKKANILTNPSYVLEKKNLQGLLVRIAKEHPNEFATSVDALKDIGFDYSYKSGWTLRMSDLNSFKRIRNQALDKADKQVDALRARGLKGRALDSAKIQIFTKASKEMEDAVKLHLDKTDNKLYQMTKAGVKPSWSQLKQLIIAPMLLDDAKGRTIPIPVRRSYSEGLDVSGYWVAAQGARKGIIDKTQEVAKPGFLSKQIANTVMDLVVTEDDCGTPRGVQLPSKSRDILDRFTASPIKLTKGILPGGTLITPEVANTLTASKVKKVLVRSPLRCRSKQGMCAKCFGVMPNGKIPALRTNVGIQSGQAIGERSTQLAMRTFHTGGVQGGGGGITGFDRLQQILTMPSTLPGSATLSTVDGKITSVVKDPAGGWQVNVSNERHYVPQDRGLSVRTGESVSKGQALSGGSINPNELLGLTNVATVQNYLTDEIGRTYTGHGLKRRNFEVLVKAITNLSRVSNSGDHPEYIRGDFVPTSLVSGWNRENPDKAPVKMQPILKGLNTIPLTGTEDWLTRLNYQKLKDTLQQAASKGWRSNIHSSTPIPGLAFGSEFGKPPADKPWAY